MSSQNTFGEKVRLNDKVESRVRGDLYARFGGECLETYHCNKWQGAGCLAYGQLASAKIPLSRMISPALYWVMTGNDFTLDINNPAAPKILVVGNNPDRQNIYSAALGLYNSRIVKLINKKKQLKSSVIIDELPTIYFRGLDNLIATARSNKVAVCLGFQDFSQLTRDYGEKESRVIQNTVGNVFCDDMQNILLMFFCHSNSGSVVPFAFETFVVKLTLDLISLFICVWYGEHAVLLILRNDFLF